MPGLRQRMILYFASLTTYFAVLVTRTSRFFSTVLLVTSPAYFSALVSVPCHHDEARDSNQQPGDETDEAHQIDQRHSLKAIADKRRVREEIDQMPQSPREQ